MDRGRISLKINIVRILLAYLIITQTVLALRVPGGFSIDLGGGFPGQPQVYGRTFLMQIISIRDIYPSKTYGKQQVAKIHPH